MSNQNAASKATSSNNRWEDRWASNNIGWDQGGAHPALVSLLSEGSSGKGDELGIATSGRALVPGCGMGYDVALFAQRGLDSTGLDIAPTGVATARKYLSDAAEVSEGRLDAGKMHVEEADFFAYDPEVKFDIILDYTFLCALQPDLRPKWAAHVAHLAAPAARLITLMFPLYPLPSSPPLAEGEQVKLPEGGPPFALTENIYHQLLDEAWELIHLQKVDRSRGEGRVKGPEGGEKLGAWKKRS